MEARGGIKKAWKQQGREERGEAGKGRERCGEEEETQLPKQEGRKAMRREGDVALELEAIRGRQGSFYLQGI